MALLMMLASMLVSCQTAYQQKGYTGGYVETKVNDTTYEVRFYGNGHTSGDMVWYYWIYRCAQLTRQHGYELFTLTPQAIQTPAPLQWQPWMYNGPASGMPPAASPAGGMPIAYDDGDPAQQGRLIPMHSSGGGMHTVVVGGYATVTRWNAHGTIVMFHPPVPSYYRSALDAQRVMDQLGPYVASGGKVVPPERTIVLKTAVVMSADAMPRSLARAGTVGAPLLAAPPAAPSMPSSSPRAFAAPAATGPLASLDARVSPALFTAAQNVASAQQCDRALRVLAIDGQHALFETSCPGMPPLRIDCRGTVCAALHPGTI